MNHLKLANPKPVQNSPQQITYAGHLHHSEYMKLYKEGLTKSNMPENGIRRARFFHMIQMFKITRGVPGFTAEAGVFRGLSSFLICNYLQRENACFRGETHFMVDSFEGLSRPVEEDGDYPAKRYGEHAFTETSVEHVRNTMSDFHDVNIHKGWIPDVFQHLPDQRYRFVHIDVDVYEPTLASLQYFYPRMSTGGVIVCDDFGPWDDNNWPGCIRAVNEFASEIGSVYASFNTGNVMFIKR